MGIGSIIKDIESSKYVNFSRPSYDVWMIMWNDQSTTRVELISNNLFSFNVVLQIGHSWQKDYDEDTVVCSKSMFNRFKRLFE